MYFSLEIESCNAAILRQEDIISSLKKLVSSLEDKELPIGPNMGQVKDDNGNVIGMWLLKK